MVGVNPSIVEKKKSPIGSILGAIAAGAATIATGGAAAPAAIPAAAAGAGAGAKIGSAIQDATELGGKLGTGAGIGSTVQGIVAPDKPAAQAIPTMQRKIAPPAMEPNPILQDSLAAYRRRLGGGY